MYSTSKSSRLVLVDGCRIPFQKAGTGYRNLRSHELGRLVIRGLVDRTGIDPVHIDSVLFGTVIRDVETPNVAREAALGAGLPASVPAHTVSMSCLSSHQAITSGAEQILAGNAEVVIAGGTDSVSSFFAETDPRRMTRKAKIQPGFGKSQKWIKNIRSFLPAEKDQPLPAEQEFSTGESMGRFADRMAAMFDISREAQDAFAVRSHQSTVKAYQDGIPESELIPVAGPPDFEPITKDNGFQPDCTPKNLAALQPKFTKNHGTVTAGNSVFHADGAAAVLLMSEARAEHLGLKPKVRLHSWVYSARDPKTEMLFGQAYAIPMLLEKTGFTLSDIDVFELHEAFAGQVLSVMDALRSPDFAQNRLGKKQEVGSIPLKKLNLLGGTLAIGHPFAATGARLLTTAANRLLREHGTRALVSSCAVGGLGHAMLLEAVSSDSSSS